MKKRFTVLTLIFCMVVGVVFTASAQKSTNTMPEEQHTAGMIITRLVVGTGVDNREPVGISDTFSVSTEKVICFLDVANIAEDTTITFVWIVNGKEVLRTDLPISKGPRWRTRADKKLYQQKGNWKVEIRDNTGLMLKAIEFKVE